MVLWNGTCTFYDPLCRFLRIPLAHFGNELDHIAAAASSETVIQPLCGSNDEAALVAALVYRATSAQLRIVLFERDTKEL